MHQVIIRSSIRRLRNAAPKQHVLYSAFSSTTGTPSISNNSKGESNNNVKNDPRTTHVSSANTDTITSKVGSSTSLSLGSGVDLSIGNSATISEKASSVTSATSSGSRVSKSSYSNNAESVSNDADESSEPEFRNVYVHPLSQIVLEYLQNSHHEWVVAKGLDRSLTLHRDGSFELKHVLQFHLPTSKPIPTTTSPPSSSTDKIERNSNFKKLLSTSTSAIEQKQSATVRDTKSTSPTKDSSNSKVTETVLSKKQQQEVVDTNNNFRIWTSYDESEKKHWLTVRRGIFRQRFLLQDNLLTAWQGNRGASLPERLHSAVDEMIESIDQLDQKQRSSLVVQQHWDRKGPRRFRKR